MATVAICLPQITRSYGPDEATEVGAFVVTPSLMDPFRRQLLFTNHPLLSFFDHVIYTVTGNSSEWVMRIVPIIAGALAVFLLAYACTRRFGVLAGGVSALIAMTSPEFLKETESVRGYPMLALFAIATALLTLQMVDHPPPRGWRAVGFVVLGAAGIATHVWMVLPLGLELVYVVTKRRLSIPWLGLFAVAGGLGSLTYLHMARTMLREGRSRGSLFRPGFPFDVATSWLGTETVAVVLTLVLVGVTLYAFRRSQVAYALAAGFVLAVGPFWVVLRPFDLYPRFLVWGVLAVGAAAAFAVARWPKLALVALAAAAFGFASNVRTWSQPPSMGNKEAAQLIDANNRAGGKSCTVGYDGAILAYTKSFTNVSTPSQYASCGLVVWLSQVRKSSRLYARLQAEFPYSTTLKARHITVVFSRTPIGPVQR